MIIIKNKEIAELWINKINEFISELDISDSLKNQVCFALVSQKELIESGAVVDEIYGSGYFGENTYEKFYNECLSFMNYLSKILKTKGSKYFEFGIEYALNCGSDLSFIDNFLRFIVITNYNDIEVVENINVDNMLSLSCINDFNSAQGSVRGYLGGFLLGDLSSFTALEYEQGDRYLDFYNFHSRKNLTRMKIGPLLIKKLLHKMVYDDRLRDFSLCSAWVMKNNSLGKKFYKKMGFKFIGPDGEIVDDDPYADCVKVKREDYPNLTDREFRELSDKMDSNCIVLVPSEEKQRILDRDFGIPYIEYKGKKIDCNTDFTSLEKTY